MLPAREHALARQAARSERRTGKPSVGVARGALAGRTHAPVVDVLQHHAPRRPVHADALKTEGAAICAEVAGVRWRSRVSRCVGRRIRRSARRVRAARDQQWKQSENEAHGGGDYAVSPPDVTCGDIVAGNTDSAATTCRRSTARTRSRTAAGQRSVSWPRGHPQTHRQRASNGRGAQASLAPPRDRAARHRGPRHQARPRAAPRRPIDGRLRATDARAGSSHREAYARHSQNFN